MERFSKIANGFYAHIVWQVSEYVSLVQQHKIVEFFWAFMILEICGCVRITWTQDVNWAYIKRSEDLKDVFWTSWVCSIYVLCPEGGGGGEISYIIPISHSLITRIIWYNIMLLDRHIWRKEKMIPYKRTHSWTSKSIKWELVSVSWFSQELSLSPLHAYLIFKFFGRIFAFKCTVSPLKIHVKYRFHQYHWWNVLHWVINLIRLPLVEN